VGDTSLWHPFADMAAVRGNEFVVSRGEGVHLWDEAGNRYLDGSASLWYCNVGHGRAEIADAVAEQLSTLETYSGHAAVCAAALANIDILERERLVPRGRDLEGELLSRLAPLADHPLVGEVRGGTGMLVGIALDRDALASEPGLTAKASASVRSHGVILRALGETLAVSPPLTISSSEIDLIRDAVRAGLDALVESRAPVA